LKILQLIPRFPWPLKDGGAIGYYNFANAYIEAGHELTIAALNTNKHYITYDAIPNHIKDKATIHLIDINTDVNKKDAFFNLFSNKSYNVQRFISKEYEQLVTKLCANTSYDIIIFESIFVAPYLKKIKAVTPAKCVLREHNVEYKIWESLAATTPFGAKKVYLNLLAHRIKNFEINVCKQFDALYPITPTDAQLLQDSGVTTPMHIVPFGINTNALPHNKPYKELTFFHLGSMDWEPNKHAVQWFINNVWLPLAPQFPHVSFVIAGRNMPQQFLNYHNTHNIKVMGEIDNAFDFMQHNAVQVVPLFAGSGIRVKILEAMALGKCIIATPLGAQGINYTMDENICIATDASEFLKEMVGLIDAPERITYIGNNAKQLAQSQYNVTILAEQILTQL
jgi:polysaccharide biosynthesis protein PslH